MAHFGETLGKLRNARGLSQVQLGTKVGVSDQRISDWEGMASPKMRGFNYANLAAALGMTTSDLDRAWRVGRVEQSVGDPGRRGIPLINKAPAGNVVNYDECSIIDSGQGIWYVLRDGISDPSAFAVVVKGDSMIPALQDGVIAIFSPMDQDGKIHESRHQVPEGHIVFVRFATASNRDGCTIARWSWGKNKAIKLTKDNRKYKALTAGPDEIQMMAALVRHDQFPGISKTFAATEQLQSKGEKDSQQEGQVHPEPERQSPPEY